MSKIIEITNQIISIGTDDGGIKEVRSDDINFVPHIGDEVEIFETETRIIVSKVEKKDAQFGIPAGGININLQNLQGSQNTVDPELVNAKRGKVVDKVTYCLLAFFLGTFGVHSFYSGHTGTGILCILFSWTGIPTLAGIICGITALCKKANAQGKIVM